MRKLSWYTRACALFAALATAAVLLPAQTFALDSFDDADGAAPWATLVQGSDGKSLGRHKMAETLPAPWAVARSSKSPPMAR